MCLARSHKRNKPVAIFCVGNMPLVFGELKMALSPPPVSMSVAEAPTLKKQTLDFVYPAAQIPR